MTVCDECGDESNSAPGLECGRVEDGAAPCMGVYRAMRAFTAIVKFEFPPNMSAESLAQVTLAAINNSARDVGARNVRSQLLSSVPPLP